MEKVIREFSYSYEEIEEAILIHVTRKGKFHWMKEDITLDWDSNEKGELTIDFTVYEGGGYC